MGKPPAGRSGRRLLHIDPRPGPPTFGTVDAFRLRDRGNRMRRPRFMFSSPLRRPFLPRSVPHRPYHQFTASLSFLRPLSISSLLSFQSEGHSFARASSFSSIKSTRSKRLKYSALRASSSAVVVSTAQTISKAFFFISLNSLYTASQYRRTPDSSF